MVASVISAKLIHGIALLKQDAGGRIAVLHILADLIMHVRHRGCKSIS